MKLYIQYHGSMHCDRRWMVAGTNFATRHDRSPDTVWYDCPTLTLLVEHADGLILIDTSCPRDWEERWAPAGFNEVFPYDTVTEEQYLDSTLAARGISPRDLDAVVFTHLHFDHAGNTAMFAENGVKLFAHPAELEAVKAIEGPFEGAHLKADFEAYEIQPLDMEREILPGVRPIFLPGHAFGMTGLLFDLPNTGPLLYAGDAVYCGENYGPPVAMPGSVWSSLDWLASVEIVRRLASEHAATVVYGHDSDQVHNQLKLAPAYYD
jgi:glyoxylase-like metal-dependent hydrolase (beta-lactamase superfamily II)